MEQLKATILSDNWEVAKNASDQLSEIGGKEIIDFFITLLDSEKARVRNVAALGLRAIKDNQARDPLLNAIYKKENNRGHWCMLYRHWIAHINC